MKVIYGKGMCYNIVLNLDLIGKAVSVKAALNKIQIPHDSYIFGILVLTLGQCEEVKSLNQKITFKSMHSKNKHNRNTLLIVPFFWKTNCLGMRRCSRFIWLMLLSLAVNSFHSFPLFSLFNFM